MKNFFKRKKDFDDKVDDVSSDLNLDENKDSAILDDLELDLKDDKKSNKKLILLVVSFLFFVLSIGAYYYFTMSNNDYEFKIRKNYSQINKKNKSNMTKKSVSRKNKKSKVMSKNKKSQLNREEINKIKNNDNKSAKLKNNINTDLFSDLNIGVKIKNPFDLNNISSEIYTLNIQSKILKKKYELYKQYSKLLEEQLKIKELEKKLSSSNSKNKSRNSEDFFLENENPQPRERENQSAEEDISDAISFLINSMDNESSEKTESKISPENDLNFSFDQLKDTKQSDTQLLNSRVDDIIDVFDNFYNNFEMVFTEYKSYEYERISSFSEKLQRAFGFIISLSKLIDYADLKNNCIVLNYSFKEISTKDRLCMNSKIYFDSFIVYIKNIYFLDKKVVLTLELKDNNLLIATDFKYEYSYE